MREGELSEPSKPLLFFSTRQGRQSNCVLTVEVARFVAERLDRRLVIPWCHTSPLGEQACAHRPDIPPQRQAVVYFALQKMLQLRDLSRCQRPASVTSLPAIAPMDLAIHAMARNVTCLDLAPRSANRIIERTPGQMSPCEKELLSDGDLRSQLPIRFTRTVTLDADTAFGSFIGARVALPGLLNKRQAALGFVPPGDIFLHNAFWLMSKQSLGPMFGLCSLPRETEDVMRMERTLFRALALPRASTLCFHWRAEDFHHPTTLAKHGLKAEDSNGAHVGGRVANRARALHANSVLVVTNARFEALSDLLDTLRSSGLRAESPRNVPGSTFGCDTRYAYTTIAEQLTCSRMRHFMGSTRSSFSHHIKAMRAARGLNSSTDSML